MLQFIELSTKKVRSITLHVNVENEILGKNTLWPRWLVCPQPSCPGWGGPVCSPLVSKMGQGWLCLPRLTHGESLPRGGESGCQAAGRWAISTLPEKYLGPWELPQRPPLQSGQSPPRRRGERRFLMQ